MRVIRRRQRQWHCSRCPESMCARSKGVEMSKRSKRMLKLMTLRVGCAELLQAAGVTVETPKLGSDDDS